MVNMITSGSTPCVGVLDLAGIVAVRFRHLFEKGDFLLIRVFKPFMGLRGSLGAICCNLFHSSKSSHSTRSSNC